MSNVRPMQVNDIPRCRAIIAGSEFFVSYGLCPDAVAKRLADALDDSHSALHVATSNDTVMGFSWVLPEGGFGRSPYLRLLAVDTHAHRSGIGRALMTAMEQRYEASRDLLLLVTETNTQAQGFYERLGYQRVGILTDYTQEGTHECIYRKRLSR